MKHSGTARLETERLILRRFTMYDAKDMFKNWAADEQVARYLVWPPHANIQTSRKILKLWTNEYGRDNFYNWCIQWKENGQAIGSIGLVGTENGSETADVGYCLSKAYWHKGIMTEALGAVVKYIFQETDIRKLTARHDVRNPNSGLVMKKCGFQFKETIPHVYEKNSEPCQMAYYFLPNPRFSDS